MYYKFAVKPAPSYLPFTNRDINGRKEDIFFRWGEN
jgi:hypothetical protein